MVKLTIAHVMDVDREQRDRIVRLQSTALAELLHHLTELLRTQDARIVEILAVGRLLLPCVGVRERARDKARRDREQVLLVEAPLLEVQMIDLDHRDNPAVVDNRCGKIGNILHEVAVDKDLVLLEHTLQIRMILHAQRARQLVGAVAETYLLAQIVAALAHHIDHDILDAQDFCRHGCRLRIEVLCLDRIQT